MKEKNELQFEVVSDPDSEVARNYGLVYPVTGKIREMFGAFGVDLGAHNNAEEWELPVPATYVVDREGTIRYAFAKSQYTLRAEPDEVLGALKSL